MKLKMKIVSNCMRIIWFASVVLFSLSILGTSAGWTCPGRWIEEVESEQITGGDGSGEKFINGVKCGRRSQSGTSVDVKVWVIPVVGDVTNYQAHDWTCYGWWAHRAKVDWVFDENATEGLVNKPAGRYADTWNHSTGWYSFTNDLTGEGVGAQVRYYSRCYSGYFDQAQSPDGYTGGAESGTVNLSITANNQQVPGGVWKEMVRRSATAQAFVWEGTPVDNDRETAYVRAQGLNSGGSASWAWKGYYY